MNQEEMKRCISNVAKYTGWYLPPSYMITDEYISDSEYHDCWYYEPRWSWLIDAIKYIFEKKSVNLFDPRLDEEETLSVITRFIESDKPHTL